LYDLVRGHADEAPDVLAIISELDGVRTYRELADRSVRLGQALQHGLGVAIGERIAVWMWNRPEYIETTLACGAYGLPVVAANPEWADAEMGFVLAHSQARVLICEPDLAARARALADAAPRLEHVIVAGTATAATAGVATYESVVASAPPAAECTPPEVPEDLPSTLLYTSGTTTGRPKAVPMARALMTTAIDYVEMFGLEQTDRCIFVTPLFHGNGAGAMISALSNGVSAVFQRRFSASRFWRLVDLHRPTYLFTLAPIVNMLMALPPSPIERRNTLRVIMALGSAQAGPAMEERYGVPVMDWYGMTEAGTGTYTRLADERRPGSAGRPFDEGVMRIMRDDGSFAETGEVGEVVFEARAVGFEGYVEDTEATASALDAGWFHTGDLGRFDEDGFFFYVDRKKDVVRRAGENISSMEVEIALRQHPAVADLAVLGRPDPVLGERVVAFVVAAPGTVAPSPEELRTFVDGRLATFKVPEEVHPVDELPRTATGKVEKFRLRQLLEQGSSRRPSAQANARTGRSTPR
jgi:acyl-CoA synthetase (AMP-forming)/AMP-acid ligase II